MNIIQCPTPNHEARPGGALPLYIILHYTGTPTAAEAARRYLETEPSDNAGRLSPHYMIDYDGAVTQFVADERRAWHAGRSFWRGLTDLNSWSIGIEIVNPGHQNGYTPFKPAQMHSLTALCGGLTARYAIPPENILGHSDIAPERKDDPGELLDWRQLAAEGIGLWPQEENGPRLSETALDKALIAYGYDPDASPARRLLAFRRHFVPEAFVGGDQDLSLSAARLRGLEKP